MPNLNEPQPFPRDEVLASALRGKAESVAELLESYRAYLRVLAASRLRGRLASRISPSDVVQETMMAAHCAIGDFRGDTTAEFSAWMRRILTHKLISSMDRHLSLKRDARREVSIDATASHSETDAPTFAGILAGRDPSPSTMVVRQEDSQRAAALVEQLPPHYREVILLRCKHGLQFDEIAARLNRSQVATRLLWLRAIQRLRKMFDQGI